MQTGSARRNKLEANNARDERLAMAYQLLRELMEQPADEGSLLQEPRELPFVRPEDTSGILSATDLLTWWFRPTSRMADPWEDYFDPRRQPPGSAPPRPPAQRPPAAMRSPLPAPNPGLRDRTGPPWSDPATAAVPWID
ncbi:MAG: hypothetical protein M3328_08320, partial [Chloroflexota bacterium]|nr:hypothetical protein [Chloroflexota bacterium]